MSGFINDHAQAQQKIEKRRRNRQIKMCVSKQQFQSEAKANAHLATLPERFSECRSYECPQCSCWHVGRDTRNNNDG